MKLFLYCHFKFLQNWRIRIISHTRSLQWLQYQQRSKQRTKWIYQPMTTTPINTVLRCFWNINAVHDSNICRHAVHPVRSEQLLLWQHPETLHLVKPLPTTETEQKIDHGIDFSKTKESVAARLWSLRVKKSKEKNRSRARKKTAKLPVSQIRDFYFIYIYLSCRNSVITRITIINGSRLDRNRYETNETNKFLPYNSY